MQNSQRIRVRETDPFLLLLALPQLPIVPESDFFATTRSILGIPLVPATRVALRVYTADPRPDAAITVRVYEMAPWHPGNPAHVQAPQLLAQRTFTFAYDPSQDTCGFLGCPEGVRYIPGLVQINNLYDATPDLRYWPLVTATRDMDGFVSAFTVR